MCTYVLSLPKPVHVCLLVTIDTIRMEVGTRHVRYHALDNLHINGDFVQGRRSYHLGKHTTRRLRTSTC